MSRKMLHLRPTLNIYTYTLTWMLIQLSCRGFTQRSTFHPHTHPRFTSRHNRHQSLLHMGKGDGKKKRPKKQQQQQSTTTTNNTPSNPTTTPQRVTTEINIPIRTQLRFAKMKKEASIRASSSSYTAKNVKRTKYRKTLDEEEEEAARVARRDLRKEPDWDVILNNNGNSPLVIVDAYNIIYKWPRLKKWMTKGMLSKARDLLISDLEELQRLRGWRIEVVFDGGGRKLEGPMGDGPGGSTHAAKIPLSETVNKAKVTSHGIRVVYSGISVSADTYIEARCYEAKQVTEGKITGDLIVASDDNMIRVAAQNAGAVAMSADRLLDILKSVRKTALHRVEVAVAKVNGRAVRPTKLYGTEMTNVFGKGGFIIEDKRNRKTGRRKKSEEERLPMNAKEIMDGTTTMPSWAIMPNRTKV